MEIVLDKEKFPELSKMKPEELEKQILLLLKLYNWEPNENNIYAVLAFLESDLEHVRCQL